MRLRRGSRTAGPIAAHNSRYGPQNTATITSAQRDAIYQQIIDRLSVAGNLSLLVEQNDLGAARRLADQLRRTFARLRERASEQREESSQGVVEAPTLHERSSIVIEACDKVLAVVGSS
jgi:hypothetical protein